VGHSDRAALDRAGERRTVGIVVPGVEHGLRGDAEGCARLGRSGRGGRILVGRLRLRPRVARLVRLRALRGVALLARLDADGAQADVGDA
jgi:hypothetical protein